ncbi:MAG: protein TolQ [Rhodothalassiaceae bacterium]
MQDAVPTGPVAAESIGPEVPGFTPVDMFLQADWVVKTVMILLVLASVYAWGVIFASGFRLRKASRRADEFEQAFWSGTSLDELYENLRERAANHPMALIFVAAMREWQRSLSGRAQVRDRMSVEDRVDKVVGVTIQREMQKLEGQIGFLATLGSAAPFIGLFGTVWGIMNSFQDIASTANTSLAVVAPGIAEALLATALGLVAAIPAVVAYNKRSADLARFAGRLEGFAGEFQALLSRQMDERAA